MNDADPSITQFTDKYERGNFLTRWLLNNFFSAVRQAIPMKSKILEIGCGAGYSAEELFTYVEALSYHASDVDGRLATMARERVTGITTATESVYSLPHADNSFDVVIGLETLEHLERPSDALAEMLRVSRDLVIVSVPHEPWWRILNCLRGKYLSDLGNTPGHINHWSAHSFAEFVGRQARVISRRLPTPWIVVVAKKTPPNYDISDL